MEIAAKDKLLWYHLGKKRGGGGSGGGGTSVTKRDLLAQTKVDGFAPNSELPGAYARNCYFGEEGFESFEISVGENYTVVWDNVAYKVTAKDASAFLPGVILLGNDFGTELGSNNEPFAIGWFGAGFTLFALDTLASHTIHIYQTVLDNAEVRTVGLDATHGSQIIKPTEDGKSMSEAIITMPDTLIPENIAEGVDIGGVIGTLAGGGGAKVAYAVVYPSTTSNVTVTHNLGVVPDFIYILCAETTTTGKVVSAHSIRSGVSLKAWLPTMARLYGTKNVYADYKYSTDANNVIHDANETTFQIGNSTHTLQTSKGYYWLAVAGIF